MAKRPFRLTYPDPTEDQFQQSVASLLDAILRPEEATYTHIGHGGYELSPAARARLYRLGLKRGWPDICIVCRPGRVLWLELKTATGRLSLEQRQRHAQFILMGHHVVVCRRIEDVITALELHQVPFRTARLDGSYHGAQVHQSNAQSGPQEPAQGQASSAEGMRHA